MNLRDLHGARPLVNNSQEYFDQPYYRSQTNHDIFNAIGDMPDSPTVSNSITRLRSN